MLTLLMPAVVAAFVALVWTGSLAGLRRLRVTWWPLGFGSLAVQLVIHNPPFNQQGWALAWGPPIWVICIMAMLAVLVCNALSPGAARYGWQLAALGVALNLLVVLANGGYMPLSQPARIAVRGAALPADANVTELHNVTPMSPETRLAWFGDVIPQPRWLPMANVVSVGDVMLSLGMATLAFLTIGRRSPHVGGTLADS
jgi:Family of unknown function (DUF5317)